MTIFNTNTAPYIMAAQPFSWGFQQPMRCREVTRVVAVDLAMVRAVAIGSGKTKDTVSSSKVCCDT